LERSQVSHDPSTITSTTSSKPEQGFNNTSDLDINKMITEPKVRNTLLEHAVGELSSENLIFVVKIRTWKSIWEKESTEKITKIATNIYKEFIDRDSITPINIPISMFAKVEKYMKPYLDSTNSKPSAISDVENGKRLEKPLISIFDQCEKECLMILETDTLPRFAKSELFEENVIKKGLVQKILKSG